MFLLSEERFRKCLEKKIAAPAQLSACSVYQQACDKAEKIYHSSIVKLEDQLKKNNSWFDKNRGTLGLLTGLVVGVGVSIGIVHAVYPQ